MVKTSLKEINVSKVRNKPPSQYKHNSIDGGSKGKNKKFVEFDGEWGTFKDFPKVKKAKDSGSKTCPLSYGDAVKIINQLEKASKGKAFETED